MVISHFTGTKDAMCPITLCFDGDLTHPVAIQPAYNQPYELTALWRWILSTKKHPLLPSISCSLSDIVTLDLSGARMTESVLEVMLQTAPEERDFRDGVSELSDALDRLNRSITIPLIFFLVFHKRHWVCATNCQSARKLCKKICACGERVCVCERERERKSLP